MIDYSQNFLLNPKLVEKLIEKTEITSGDLVLDIGAGEGIITKALLKKVGERGNVVAIELDNSLIPKLTENLDTFNNVEIVNQDIKEYIFPDQPFKVFSNIPFNITSEIMNILLSPLSNMQEGSLIIQREAALMYSGEQLRRENTLKSSLAYPFFTFDISYNFRSSDFVPEPSVDIVLLKINRREIPLVKTKDTKTYFDFMTYISQDRAGEGSWKKLYTSKQINYMFERFGLVKGKGLKQQTMSAILKAFNAYLLDTPVQRKNYALNAYTHHFEKQAKMEKVHRTRF